MVADNAVAASVWPGWTASVWPGWTALLARGLPTCGPSGLQAAFRVAHANFSTVARVYCSRVARGLLRK